MYTALVINEYNQTVLVDAVERLLPNIRETHPEIVAHHSTLNMGAIDNSLNPGAHVGEMVSLGVESLAYDDKVVAVKVETPILRTKNQVMHITVAVNRENGGKPFLSNKLDWNKAVPIQLDQYLAATVEECN